MNMLVIGGAIGGLVLLCCCLGCCVLGCCAVQRKKKNAAASKKKKAATLAAKKKKQVQQKKKQQQGQAQSQQNGNKDPNGHDQSNNYQTPPQSSYPPSLQQIQQQQQQPPQLIIVPTPAQPSQIPHVQSMPQLIQAPSMAGTTAMISSPPMTQPQFVQPNGVMMTQQSQFNQSIHSNTTTTTAAETNSSNGNNENKNKRRNGSSDELIDSLRNSLVRLNDTLERREEIDLQEIDDMHDRAMALHRSSSMDQLYHPHHQIQSRRRSMGDVPGSGSPVRRVRSMNVTNAMKYSADRSASRSTASLSASRSESNTPSRMNRRGSAASSITWDGGRGRNEYKLENGLAFQRSNTVGGDPRDVRRSWDIASNYDDHGNYDNDHRGGGYLSNTMLDSSQHSSMKRRGSVGLDLSDYQREEMEASMPSVASAISLQQEEMLDKLNSSLNRLNHSLNSVERGEFREQHQARSSENSTNDSIEEPRQREMKRATFKTSNVSKSGLTNSLENDGIEVTYEEGMEVSLPKVLRPKRGNHNDMALPFQSSSVFSPSRTDSFNKPLVRRDYKLTENDKQTKQKNAIKEINRQNSSSGNKSGLATYLMPKPISSKARSASFRRRSTDGSNSLTMLSPLSEKIGGDDDSIESLTEDEESPLPKTIHGEENRTNSSKTDSHSSKSSDSKSVLLGTLGSSQILDIYAPPGILGLLLDFPDEEEGGGWPVVHEVRPQSVLGQQLQVGDRIMSIDGRDLRNMIGMEILKTMNQFYDGERVVTVLKMIH